MMRRLNIGCGQSATPGWVNYDNSPSIALARLPKPLISLLGSIGILSELTQKFVAYCRTHSVRYASALSIPEASGSVDVVYSSHMLEHLDRTEARLCLQECYRILKPGGILRLVVPDLKQRIDYYMLVRDGDQLLESFIFDLEKPRGLRPWMTRAITGGREHHWMYDYASLARLAESCGFRDTVELQPGQTSIGEPGELDLREQELTWSLYLETRRPLQEAAGAVAGQPAKSMANAGASTNP